MKEKLYKFFGLNKYNLNSNLKDSSVVKLAWQSVPVARKVLVSISQEKKQKCNNSER